MTTLMQVLMELPTTLVVLLKMTVLLGAGWILHFALARRNRRWRVFVWRGVMAGLLLLPVAELVLPRLEVAVAPAPTVVESAPEVIPYEPAVAAPSEVSLAPMTTVPTVEAPDPPGMFAWMKEHFSILLLAAWGLVATIMAMRCLFSVKNVRRMVEGSRSAPVGLYRLMETVAQETRCRTRVNLRLSPDLGSPFLAGLIRPVMMLPERMADEDHADELPAVLAHELAHLNSCDLVWMTLGRWLSVLLWFHPLAWKVRAAHGTACEQVCDAVAADYAGGAPAYSRTLARLALELVVDAPVAGGIAMIRTSEITRRLRNLKRGIKAAALARPWVVASVLLGCVTLFGIGCLKLVTADRSAAEFPASLERGLVLHYSFDAEEGRTVTDLSGKGNHGRVHSGTYTPDGKIGRAMFFDVHGDIGDSIDIGADPSIQTDVFTLAAWIRTSLPASVTQTILGFGRSAYAVTVSSDGRLHYGRIRIVSEGEREVRISMEGGGGLSDVRTGEWLFIAVTRDADNRASIYVNGEFEEWYITDGRSEFYLAGQIGGQFYRGEHFNGAMDEVRVYDRALSASEIKRLYDVTLAAGKPTGVRSSDTAVEGVRIEPEDWGIPITGVLRDESGKPVPGALVLPLPHGGHPAETDENGEFELAGPSRGSFERCILNLFARDPGRNLGAVVKLGDYSKPIDITLTPAVTVTGRVTDPQGNPIAGADVGRASVRTKTYGAGFGLTVWPPADSHGRFALKALPLGYEYSMGVSADGYGSERVRLGLLSEPGIKELEDIVLQPAGESPTRTVSDSSSETPSSGPPRGVGLPDVIPGQPLPAMVVDAYAAEPAVKLPGVKVSLRAIVSADGELWKPDGSSFDGTMLDSEAHENKAVSEYLEMSAKESQREGSRTEGKFGTLMRFARTDAFKGEVGIHRAAPSRWLLRALRFDGITTWDEGKEAFCELVQFEMRDQEGRPLNLCDIVTEISYGPPLKESVDIDLWAKETLYSRDWVAFDATVVNLPEEDPAREVPPADRPRVILRRHAGGPLTNYEVRAVRKDGQMVRASKRPYLDGVSWSLGRVHEWVFGWPDPISASSIDKFILIGYLVQPIEWRGISLQPKSRSDMAVSEIARRETAAAAEIERLGGRVVRFPEDRSMGKLYVRDPGAEDWYMDVEELGEARGRVAVPKGKELKLEVSEDAARDLSPLAKLRPGDLQMLGFWFMKTTVGSLAPLANLTGLKALNLQNGKFNCEDLSYLTGMTELEVLRLGDHQLTDESMRHVGKLTSLKFLALWSTGISDEGLKHLQGLRNLTFLALNDCAISDRGLEYLRNMAELEGLQLPRTAITDDGLAHLKALTKLKSILLDGNNITDAGVRHLQNLASLEIVSINDNPITDEGLAYLSGLENLKALYVGRTQITDAGMAQLEGLKHIWHVYLTGIGDEGLAHLSGLPALEFIQIHDAEVTEASIPSLTKMESLKRLLVSGDQVYEDMLLALRVALPDCDIYDPQQGDYPRRAWTKRFDSVYGLEDDEILRRIPPPFIPERMDFYRHEHSRQAEVIPGGPDYFTFHWDKKLTNWGMGFTDNLSLQAVLHRTLGLESFECEGPEEMLSLQLPGDWIVRPGAPMREKLSALEQIVANDLGLSVRFEERSVQRDVIVADGKYEFHPEPNAYNDTSVHIFADKLDPDEGAGGGTGTVTKFLRWVGNRVGIPIINETEMPDEFELSWGNHRSSRLRRLLEPERSKKLDMVVANLARQTSLTFTKERREVDVWFVSEK
jgi:beta-lactamase regulating signal transducer with metallopeptidase domain/Leucine-rich repeat (LRR) protein